MLDLNLQRKVHLLLLFMLPNISIVIVNWNSSDQLSECLNSIVNSDHIKFSLDSVIVVDNNSTDKSLDGIEDLNLPLNLIKNIENKGFGFACNQGSAISQSDYILFLNPDTRLDQNALDRSIDFIESPSHQKVGIVGIQLVDNQGKIQKSCARFPTPINFWCSIVGLDKVIKNKFTSYLMTEWNHQNTQQVDHVMGAFYLIRRDIFQLLNGFDESFFVYFEDLDFSYRLSRLGWSSYYLTEVRSFHKGGGTSESIKSTRVFYALRSRILYVYKHFNLMQANTVTFGFILIEPFTRIIFSVMRLSLSQMRETTSAYIQLFGNFQEIYELVCQKIIRK
jgi:N-acetylglucosaminyl-diphospho-decaprenol L-rhamnosyltransferase